MFRNLRWALFVEGGGHENVRLSSKREVGSEFGVKWTMRWLVK